MIIFTCVIDIYIAKCKWRDISLFFLCVFFSKSFAFRQKTFAPFQLQAIGQYMGFFLACFFQYLLFTIKIELHFIGIIAPFAVVLMKSAFSWRQTNAFLIIIFTVRVRVPPNGERQLSSGRIRTNISIQIQLMKLVGTYSYSGSCTQQIYYDWIVSYRVFWEMVIFMLKRNRNRNNRGRRCDQGCDNVTWFGISTIIIIWPILS